MLETKTPPSGGVFLSLQITSYSLVCIKINVVLYLNQYKMKTHHTDIVKAAERLVAKIIRADADVTERIIIFNSILKKLPRLTLVDKEGLGPEAIFRGVVHLFPEAYFSHHTPEQRKKLMAAISFLAGDQAIICVGWYDGDVIFKGSWIEALKVILEMMSLTEIGMTEKEKSALNTFLEALK
ncbi:hypothetical protein CVU83_01325 [Candidatus Falkowbacteria bacterium HGW-Falkowbacteria-2]|uniref:Uncharacterized protein n=1 Tax=Candidatus Falkowbacteria bacterium HGW-Falkowbacteria-2 TaxID=2013769 RepID=A0A2N2E1P1_9BACT|nr:MAG: hypothetical protein CVU83_01325 [Candidatus Falkowbacteria bacterium HGW-Falkowbacteria-2]